MLTTDISVNNQTGKIKTGEKMMKKKIVSMFLALSLMLGTASMASCSDNAENTAPTLSGVKDTLTVEAGTQFDALDGVTASDKEDGDLTSKIVVTSMPALDFVDGKATPVSAGTYELTYSVNDSGNLSAEVYSTLTVSRKKAEAEELYRFDFSSDAAGDLKNWYGGFADPATGAAGVKEGAIVYEITNPGTDAGQVMLKKMIDVKPASYTVKFFLKSSAPTYIHIGARKASSAVFENYNAVFGLAVGTTMQAYTLDFVVTEEGQCELGLYLGKIVFDETHASPDNYTVTIVKAEIYETVGTETEDVKYYQDFSESANSVSLIAFQNADATVTNENGAAKVTINAYPDDNASWNLKSVLGLGDVTLDGNETYYYKVKVTAKNAQSGEICVESNETEWQNRASFAAFSLAAGETKELSAQFAFNGTINDVVIKLYLGSSSEGVTSNELVIDDLSFGLIRGDKITESTIDRFMSFGKGSANYTNTNTVWDTFNGTDEGNEKGIGTIWTENNELNYRIYEAGNVDWYNKLFFGYTDNPLVLPANCYFTIKFTARATKDVTCAMILNPLGEWNPRFTEQVNITTEVQEFEFTISQELVLEMPFELLFQFGSESTAQLGEVTITFSDMVILKNQIA